MSLFGLDQQTILVIAAVVGAVALLLLLVRRLLRSRMGQTQRTRAMHRVPHGIAADPRPDPPWYTGTPTLLPPHADPPPGKVVTISERGDKHAESMYPSHLTETQSNLPLDYHSTRYEDLFPPNDSDDTAASVGRNHTAQH